VTQNDRHSTLWRHLHSLRAALPAHHVPQKPAIKREVIRTWVNGTFHGVAFVWQHRYLQEIVARWTYGAALLAIALRRFFTAGGAISLQAARVPP
jgi:hypothetical protein